MRLLKPLCALLLTLLAACGSPPGPNIAVSLTPQEQNTPATQPVNLNVTVTGASDPAVNWSANPSAGATLTPTATGATFSATEPGIYSIAASSIQDPSRQATARVTVLPRPTVSLDNPSAQVQTDTPVSFTATVGNATDTGVTWEVEPETAINVQTVGQKATFTFAQAGTYTITAHTRATPSASASATVTVNPAVAVTLDPATATFQAGDTQTFTASVQNTPDTRLIFTATPSSGVTLSQTGTSVSFRALEPGSYALLAASQADPTKSAVAQITVTPGPQVTVSPLTANTNAGRNLTLNATVQNAADTSVSWSINPSTGASISSSNSNSVTYAFSQPGTYTVTATANANPLFKATSQITVADALNVTISPQTSNLTTGGAQAFTATVQNAFSTDEQNVSWNVTPAAGWNGSSGNYTFTAAGDYTVTATSITDPTKSASASVTVRDGISVKLNPDSLTVRTADPAAFAATVNNDPSSQGVNWSVNTPNVTESGKTSSAITYAFSQPGTYTVTATSKTDPTKSDTSTVTVIPAIQVNITPAGASVQTTQNQAFKATVQGTDNQAVTWSLSPSTGAVLSPNGNNAAFNASSPGTYTLTATSQADPTKKISVNISVRSIVRVFLSPDTASMNTAQTQDLRSSVIGTSDTRLAWSVLPQTGATLTPTANGVTFAPTRPGTYTVTATSFADPQQSASSRITVSAAQIGVSISPVADTLFIGSASVNLTATVTNTADTRTTWTLTPSSIGRLSVYDNANALFLGALTPGVATITVTSVADPSKSATATLTLKNLPSISITPGNSRTMLGAPAPTFTANLSDFSSPGPVTWSVTPTDGVTLTPSGNTVTLKATKPSVYTLNASVNDGQNPFPVTARTLVTIEPTAATTLVAGNGFSGAIRKTGDQTQWTAWTWGNNSDGQLGLGSNDSHPTILPLLGLKNLSAISAGADHMLAIRTDGTAWAWGNNAGGQLGDGTTTSRNAPVQIPGLANVTGIAAGYRVSAVTSNNRKLLSVWSASRSGGATANAGTYRELAAGKSNYIVGRLDEQPISALYGQSQFAQLGVALPISGQVMRLSTNPVTGMALALVNGGTVWSCDLNAFNTPCKTIPIVDAIGIAQGGAHALVLKSDGTVWAWGDNTYGQLGKAGGSSLSLVQVTNAAGTPLSNVVSIAAGADHSLALLSDGTVVGWGRNNTGQLGINRSDNDPHPVYQPVTGLSLVAMPWEVNR
jgi:alpha-tubulin suppressor-like RCC1 family protein